MGSPALFNYLNISGMTPAESRNIFGEVLSKKIVLSDGTVSELGNFLEYSTKQNSLVWNWNFIWPEGKGPGTKNLKERNKFVQNFTKLINPKADSTLTSEEMKDADDSFDVEEGVATEDIPTTPTDISWNTEDSQEWFNDMYAKIWNDPVLISEMDIQNTNQLAEWQGTIFELIITTFDQQDNLTESQKVDWDLLGDKYTGLDDSETRIYNYIQSMQIFANQNKGPNAQYLKKETRSTATINQLQAEGKIPFDVFDEIASDDPNFEAQLIVAGSYKNDLNIITEMNPYGRDGEQYIGNYATALKNFVKDIPENDWNSNKGNAQLFDIPLTAEAQAKENIKTNRFINDFIQDPVSAVKNLISSKPNARITADTDPITEAAINMATDDMAKRTKDGYQALLDENMSEIDAAREMLGLANRAMEIRTEATYFGIQDGVPSDFETQFLPAAYQKYFMENASTLVNDAIKARGYLPKDIDDDVKNHLLREAQSGNITSLQDWGNLIGNVYEGNSIFDLGALKAQAESFASNDALLSSVGRELLGINPFMPSGIRDQLEGGGKALAQLKEAIKVSLLTNPYSGKNPTEIASEVLQNYGLTPIGALAAFPKLYGGVLQDDGTRIFDQSILDAEEKRKKAVGQVDPITGMTEAAQMIAAQSGILPPSPDPSKFKQYDDPKNPGASLPAFRAIPEPVYEDQDVLEIIANRYYDRPELVQFLQSQIPDIAQRFRLSQRPGSLEKESFAPTGATLQFSEDAPPTFTGEYGPAIDDPTSSSAAYSYFERDRPKTIADFVSGEAIQYETAFEQSPLFTQEQERLEDERRYKDTASRQRFVSQPLTIFGRRRR